MTTLPQTIPELWQRFAPFIQDVYAKFNAIEQRLGTIDTKLAHHDDLLEIIATTVKYHSEVLDEHTKILGHHSQVLDHHSKILDRHSIMLDDLSVNHHDHEARTSRLERSVDRLQFGK